MVFVFQRCEDRQESRCNGCIWVNSLAEKRPLHAACCLRNPSYSTCCQKAFSSVLVISISRPSFFLISAVRLGHVLLFLTLTNVWDGLRRFRFRLPIIPLCPVCHIGLTLRCCLQPGTHKDSAAPRWGWASSKGSGMWHVCALHILQIRSFFWVRDPTN